MNDTLYYLKNQFYKLDFVAKEEQTFVRTWKL